jgi:repressor of nif and glnA expression
MPEILEILKRDKQLKKEEIVRRLKPFIDQKGYSERAHATGYALKYLSNEGYLHRPKHAFWAITKAGSEAFIDEDWGRGVTDKYEKPGR